MSHEISVIGDIEHIQKYPGMYIGSTNTPDHLIQEVLDNAVDELINEYANTITIDLDENECTITDNGRGIPLHKVKLEDGTEEDSIVVACTKLHSGSKFDNNAYNFSIGMHGIGLVAVNALSEEMIICVAKDTQIYLFMFSGSKLIKKEILEKTSEINWKTFVYFKVNPKFFNLNKFDSEKVENKLFLIKNKYQNSKIILNENEIDNIETVNYIKYLLDIKNDIEFSNIKFENNNIVIDMYLGYDLMSYSKVSGDVNLHPCTGVYIDNILNMYYNIITKEIFNTKILTKNDVLNNLKCYISIYMRSPKFDSQTKNRMDSNITYILTDEFKKIFNQLLQSNVSLMSHLKNIIEEKTLLKANKKITKQKKITDITNPLVDCRKCPGEILYIVEGDSAGGTLREIRNIETEAVFMLTGKVMNVDDTNIDEILESKKIKHLLEALGVDLTGQSDYRYKYIKILTDSDFDGFHIVILVLLILNRFTPDLIKEGRVSMIVPPLYAICGKNKFIPIYDMKELTKYNSNEIKRFKGLGEMNPDQLEFVIKNKYEYVLEYPTKDVLDKILQCIRDSNVKRILCDKIEEFNLNKLLTKLKNK